MAEAVKLNRRGSLKGWLDWLAAVLGKSLALRIREVRCIKIERPQAQRQRRAARLLRGGSAGSRSRDARSCSLQRMVRRFVDVCEASDGVNKRRHRIKAMPCSLAPAPNWRRRLHYRFPSFRSRCLRFVRQRIGKRRWHLVSKRMKKRYRESPMTGSNRPNPWLRR